MSHVHSFYKVSLRHNLTEWSRLWRADSYPSPAKLRSGWRIPEVLLRGAQNVSDISQPHGALIEFVIAWGKRRQRRLQTLVEGHQTQVEVMAQPPQAQLSHVMQPLVGLETGQVNVP